MLAFSAFGATSLVHLSNSKKLSKQGGLLLTVHRFCSRYSITSSYIPSDTTQDQNGGLPLASPGPIPCNQGRTTLSSPNFTSNMAQWCELLLMSCLISIPKPGRTSTVTATFQRTGCGLAKKKNIVLLVSSVRMKQLICGTAEHLLEHSPSMRSPNMHLCSKDLLRP